MELHCQETSSQKKGTYNYASRCSLSIQVRYLSLLLYGNYTLSINRLSTELQNVHTNNELYLNLLLYVIHNGNWSIFTRVGMHCVGLLLTKVSVLFQFFLKPECRINVPTLFFTFLRLQYCTIYYKW